MALIQLTKWIRAKLVINENQMLPTIELLKDQLERIIHCKAAQGHETRGLQIELRHLPASYDACASFASILRVLPMRHDWAYVEPNGLDEIWAECDGSRPIDSIGAIEASEAQARTVAAFEGAIAGCILGKPIEVDPTLDEIRAAGEAVGEWPIRDYITEAFLVSLGRRHADWTETVRDRIQFVAPDDDLNYTMLGLTLIERKGPQFGRADVMDS